MRSSRSLAAHRWIVLALTAGVACATSDKQAGDTTKASPSSGSSAAGGTTFTIAMIAKSSTNPVFIYGRQGAEAAAAELTKSSGVTVHIDWLTPPSEDGTVQAQRIAQAADAGDNAILLSASDAGKVVGAINDATARGVPVMTFDSDVPDSKRFSFYGGDDALMGRETMDELATQMKGQGHVAILAGNQNAPNLQKRVAGAKEAAKKYPGIKIVNTFYNAETPQDAAAEVVRVQNAYPDINGWAMIGGWPLFAKSLLTDLDPKRVKIVAVDALPDELAYVDAGLAPVLIAQQPYLWGYTSVKTIFDHVYLKKDVPERIEMPLIRVTKDNLGTWARQLQTWGVTGIDPKYLALPK